MKNRSRWIIIALVLVGMAGLAYWLTQPKKGAVAGTTNGTGVVSFLNNLFAPKGNSNASQPTGVVGFLNNLFDGKDNPGVAKALVSPPIYTSPGESVAVDGTDRGSGNYTANPDWIAGDYGAPQGQDYLGNSFVRTSAPTIPFEVKNRPYRRGIDYSFAEQTARGAALFKRFPEFQLVDCKIHLQGPWYSDSEANAHFSRGVETMFVMPNVRTGPTNVMDLPRARKNSMINDDLFWSVANNVANELGSNDPRYSALRQFADQHEFVSDEAAYRLLGERVWQTERYATDTTGQGALYMSVDIEQTSPFSLHQYCSGWIYMGYCGAAAAEGYTVHPYLYSEGTQQVGMHYFSDRVNGTGDPEYLNPEFDFLNNTPVVQACQQFAGVLAIDTYLQAIWGLEPLLERDGDGNLILQGNGSPVFSSLNDTVVYGQSIGLEFEEAEKCLRDLYEQSNRLYLQHHRLAGQYPHTGGMRRDYLTNTQMGSFCRNTNEGVQGILQNDRPVPAWLLDLFMALNTMLSNHNWMWSVDFNQTPTALGADQSGAWPYQAHGTIETIVRSAHRHSAFSNIQASPFKWCWFNLAIVNNMSAATGDGYHQKALLHGKIRSVNGAVWLEVLFAFPASDNRSTVFQVWVSQGGNTSIAYQCETATGRDYYYDAWPLPPVFSYSSLEGANVFVTYIDTTGVQRTFSGDYRQPANGETPPADQSNGGSQQ